MVADCVHLAMLGFQTKTRGRKHDNEKPWLKTLQSGRKREKRGKKRKISLMYI